MMFESHRRSFLQLASVAAASFVVRPAWCASRPTPIGAQLYTPHKEVQVDLPGMLAALKKIGFAIVESFSGMHNRPAKGLRAMLEDAGLRIRNAHFDYDTLESHLDYAHDLGVKHMVCAMLPRLRSLWSVLLLVGALAPQATPQKNAPTRPAITGISHVGLDEDDAAGATTLYTGLIGWPSMPGVEHKDGLRFLVNTKQYIEIFPTHGNLQQPEMDHIAFETADAAALLRYLRSKGVSVPDHLIDDPDGWKRFLVMDPEGNKVEFVQSSGAGKPVAISRTELGNQLIHLGFVVRSQQAENRFYEDILGFRHFWTGWITEGKDAWVDMQVPDGTDWIEYMLVGLSADAPRDKLASPDHFSFGVVSLDETVKQLNERCHPVQRNGDGPMRDGKRKMNLFDPGGTRVEIMEFQTVKEACCGGYHGVQPSASDVADPAP